MNAQELEKLLADVTPGEWDTNTHDYGTSNTGGAYVGVYSEDGATITHVLCRDRAGTGGAHHYAPNARLIALAPTLARRVIAAEKLAEALREARAQLKAVHDDAFKQAIGRGLQTTDGKPFSCLQINVCADVAARSGKALAAWEAAQ